MNDGTIPARSEVRLRDALHARPATHLVRLAQRFDATIRLTLRGGSANAEEVLELLALGGAIGDGLEITAEGEDADAAIVAVCELVARRFDADLVPFLGVTVVEGIAIGWAVHWRRPIARQRPPSTPEAERVRMDAALVRAQAGIAALVRALPRAEAQLFLPELEILKDLGARVRDRISAGESGESAVSAETAAETTDLLIDARARLLDALGDTDGDALGTLLRASDGERVLVTQELTPSMVATLPAHVVGIIAVADGASPSGADCSSGARTAGYASHAALLARGREIPLTFVGAHVVEAITDHDNLVLDTTEKRTRLWIAPDDARVRDAHARKASRAALRVPSPPATRPR